MKKALLTAGLVVVCLAIGIIGAAAHTQRPQLRATVSGDGMLAAQVRPLLAEGVRDRASVCVADRDARTTASFGADDSTLYQIASLSKTMVGELLRGSVQAGEVALDTRVGELLDLEGSAIADATLQQLATHTSGLGEWGDDQRDAVLSTWFIQELGGGTVHDIDLDQVLDRARADPLATVGSYHYSNIGFALLGQALARAAGTDYRTLLTTRLIEPWGLRSTLAEEELTNPPMGWSSDGRKVAAWSLGAYLPSGGVISTIADMCTYAQELVRFDDEVRASGRAALSARAPIALPDGGSSGLGWAFDKADASVAVKSGETAGFTAAIAVAEGIAVVVLSNTGQPVTDAAVRLLQSRR